MALNNLNLPRNIVLHLTEACNLKCKMCYFWGEKDSFSNRIKKQNPLEINFEMVTQLIHEFNFRYFIYK